MFAPSAVKICVLMYSVVVKMGFSVTMFMCFMHGLLAQT